MSSRKHRRRRRRLTRRQMRDSLTRPQDARQCPRFSTFMDDVARLARRANALGKPLLLVLYERVSKGEQKTAGNLARRMARLRQRVAEMDLEAHPIGFVEHNRRGCFFTDAERPVLARARNLARCLQRAHPDRTVIVVTSTRLRFARSENDRGRSAYPLEARQVEALVSMMDGVPIATLLPPDTPLRGPGSVYSYDNLCSERNGRPRKIDRPQRVRGAAKARREDNLERVRELAARGWNHCAIAREVGVGESTIRGWLGRKSVPRPTAPRVVDDVLILPGEWGDW